jgi:hypothetical protein
MPTVKRVKVSVLPESVAEPLKQDSQLATIGSNSNPGDDTAPPQVQPVDSNLNLDVGAVTPQAEVPQQPIDSKANLATGAAKPTVEMAPTSDRTEVPKWLFDKTVDFSKSGVFFIILGALFLIAAHSIIDNEHPTFVFIISLLGMSIVLFGTGTQSLGEGSLPTANARVYIAGGAGALAALFGWGAVAFSEKISEVFARKDGFARISLEIGQLRADEVANARIYARRQDGKVLPIAIHGSAVYIVAPVLRKAEQMVICIEGADREGRPIFESQCTSIGLIPSKGAIDNDPYISKAEKTIIGILKVNTSLDENLQPMRPVEFSPR